MAFANGANDNAKGVATLRGSGLASDTVAILWGTLWTFFGASRLGMPVSTTHVTCGSLFGIGLLHRNRTDWRLVGQILLAWEITLPLAALLGALLYRLFEISI